MAHLKSNSKQRIYKASVELFSRYGYTAVGVRDIAKKSSVNISMISYYYQGKIGILRNIIQTFFDKYIEQLSRLELRSSQNEDIIHTIISNIIAYIRSYTNEAIVVFTELHRDIPEITELKTRKIIQLVEIMDFLPQRLGFDHEDNIQKSIIGPALISLAFSNFLLGPLMKNVFNVKFNNEYYEKYEKEITTLFLDGVRGVAQRYNTRRKKNET